MAQTNPRPPAKPSFGLSICPAAAVGVGSASASEPEGSGEAGKADGWGQPHRLRLSPPSSLSRARRMQSSGGCQEWLGYTSQLCWGLGDSGLLWLAHTVPFRASDGVRLTHWESAQLQTGKLLLQRTCQWLFVLHLPAQSGGKWVLLGW